MNKEPTTDALELLMSQHEEMEELIEDIDVREVALGSGYILTGHAPRSRHPAVPAEEPDPSGRRDSGADVVLDVSAS